MDVVAVRGHAGDGSEAGSDGSDGSVLHRSAARSSSAPGRPPPRADRAALLGLQQSAGNAAVSGALQQLQAQAAEAGTAVEEVAPVAAPAEVRPGAVGLVEAALQGERRGRQQLAEAVRGAASEIAQDAATQAGGITAAGQAAGSQVEQQVAGAHEQLTTQAADGRARVQAEAARASGAVGAWQTGAATDVAGAYEQGTQQVDDAAAARGSAVTAAGSRASAAVDERTESARTTARPGADGGGERGQGRAAVTEKVAGPAATKIQQQGQSAAHDLARGGTEAGAKVQDVGRQASAALGQGRAADVAGVRSTADLATSQVDHVAEQGDAALEAGHQQAAADLDQAGGQAAAGLRTAADEHAAKVGEAGTVATQALVTQATEVTTQARSGIEEQLAALSTVDLPQASADEAQGELSSGIDALYAESSAGAAGHAAATRTSLGAAATQSAAALDGHVGTVRSELDAGTARFGEAATATTAAAGSKVGELNQRTLQAGGAAVGQAKAAVDAGAGHATSGLDEAGSRAAADLEAHQATTATSLDGAAADARAKVDQGRARFDDAYARRQEADTSTQALHVQRDVWGWLKGQWGDFLTMVSDPAFLVGLGVTLLLLPLGPVAMIIGGAAGGIVGGIQRNLAEGKPWSDLHNILIGGLEGAAVGALFAIATAALVFFNVGLVAGALIIGSLSAGIGIVMNLIHGQPWDRGLLANFFLAALMHLIGGAIKGRAGARPGGGATDPAPVGPKGPGAVEPRPVEPRAPMEPEGPAKPRDCFVPGTLVLTADGPVPVESVTVGTLMPTLDPATGRSSRHRVTAVRSAVVPVVLDLLVDGSLVSVSPGHPFWTTDQGWVVAGALRPGTSLLRGDGSDAMVRSIAARPAGAYQVHNLTVDGSHTYLVTDLALLVHNKGSAYSLLNTLAELVSRVQDAQRAAESQPAETPGRAAQIKQLRDLRGRLNDLQAEMNDAQPDLDGIEADAATVDQQLGALEDVLPDPPSTPEPAHAESFTAEGAFEALQRRNLWQRITERSPGRRWSARFGEAMTSDTPTVAKQKLLVTGTKAGSAPVTEELSAMYDRTSGTFQDIHESSGASKRQ